MPFYLFGESSFGVAVAVAVESSYSAYTHTWAKLVRTFIVALAGVLRVFSLFASFVAIFISLLPCFLAITTHRTHCRSLSLSSTASTAAAITSAPRAYRRRLRPPPLRPSPPTPFLAHSPCSAIGLLAHLHAPPMKWATTYPIGRAYRAHILSSVLLLLLGRVHVQHVHDSSNFVSAHCMCCERWLRCGCCIGPVAMPELLCVYAIVCFCFY